MEFDHLKEMLRGMADCGLGQMLTFRVERF